MAITDFSTTIDTILDALDTVILGKRHVTRLALSCLFAKGHLLIEDFPGVGKTTLAHTLANVLGLAYQRVQFTSDMLPADILGVSVFDRKDGQFNFHRGPVFSQLLLADEINRATPRTQSALLEAMEERQVSIDGETHPLPSPFFVIATQNPADQIGTFPLPESQLDRFLMQIQIGYPDPQTERALLLGDDRRQMIEAISAVISTKQLSSIQEAVKAVHVSDAIVDYIQKLLAYTRESNSFHFGLSPRTGLGLLAAARAWAFIDKRQLVLPEDVQRVLASVVNHRLQIKDYEYGESAAAILIDSVAIA